jgi:hypothetical protein
MHGSVFVAMSNFGDTAAEYADQGRRFPRNGAFILASQKTEK